MTNKPLTETYQEALMGKESVFILELGPLHSDAYLRVDEGELYILAPGVDTKLTRSTARQLLQVLECAKKFGLLDE